MASRQRSYDSPGNRDVHIAKMLVKSICEKGGCLKLDRRDWERFCSQVLRSSDSIDMGQYFHRFPHIFSYEEDITNRRLKLVKMKVNPSLCEDHFKKDGCHRLNCGKLHCCKYFLLGTCKFNQKCKFGHNLSNSHNYTVLEEQYMEHLSPTEIGVLLKTGQKLEQIFPKVCKFYNNEGGCRQGEKGGKCPHMHICRHYLLGDCSFGKRCKRSHNIYDDQPKKILMKHGIRVDRSPKEVLEELKAAVNEGSNYSDNNSCDSMSSSSDSEEALGAVGPAPGRARQRSSSSDSTSSTAMDSTEICTFFLRDKCKFSQACANKHPKSGLPYQWQWEDQSEWKDFEKSPNNEIELNFCDPEKDECITTDGLVKVKFDEMKFCYTNGKTGKVRRLSTKSSLGCSTSYLYLTQWHWYWKDPRGNWIEFTNEDDQNVTLDELEEEFTSNPNSILKYSAGPMNNMQYNLQEMKLLDLTSGHATDIRRRPDPFDTKTKQPSQRKQSRSSGLASSISHMKVSTVYPSSWNLEFKSDNDYFQIVPVARTEKEFDDIQQLFNASIPGGRLKSVKRIQNAELWDGFYRKKVWMEKKLNSGETLNVKQLFHGTRQLYIDAICQQGFDWRMCGSSSGTKFGKGSYFAQKASYSAKFTDCHQLFVVRVLVGEYALGHQSMVRPPPKDIRQPFGGLYDSVVDNPGDPKIFVVFTHEQAYPEYLIEY